MTTDTLMMAGMIRAAVEAGEGTPIYVPIDMGDAPTEWEVRFRNTDGSERAVLVGGTGKHKRLKSARAVINFHLGYFPDATSVSVPVIPGKPVG